MRSIIRSAALVAGVLLVAPLQAASEDGVPLFVIAREPQGFTLRTERIAPDETLVFQRGGSSDVLDVVLPVGPGRSGNLVGLDDKATIVVRRQGDTLRLEVRSGDRATSMPPRRMADLRGEDVRVSVIAGESRAAFEIRGWTDAAPDTIGPVEDLFAGQLPAAILAGQAVITTDTRTRWTGPPARGSAPLEYDRYLRVSARYGSAAAPFVVDLGAATTVVTRDFLPAGTSIVPGSMVEYSAAGRRELEEVPQGATGPVRTLGHAQLDSLVVGDIVFRDVSVSVVERLPAGLGEHVRGVLGSDLLRRGHLTLDLNPASRRRLVMGGPGGAADARAFRVPFSWVHEFLCVRAVAEGRPVRLLLDTGAPVTFLDSLAAEAVGVTATEGGRDVHGMGGQPTHSTAAQIGQLAIGDWVNTAVPCRVASLSVLRTLRSGGQSIGLLGLSTLTRARRVEFDFEARVLTLIP